ncbi:MAG: hypothetical protein IJX55_01995 [Clostridia bacterium]|nr:hypothetical protein [Clostridia bacterium]
MKSNTDVYKKINIALGVLASVLALLTLITSWAVIMRVGDFLPNETDVILLIPKEPSLEVNDTDGVTWETSTDIEIFKARYTNEAGDVTVSTLGKDKLIAPGTQNEYKFYVRNNGNVALDFEVMFFATFTKNGVPLDMTLVDFPIEVRLSNQMGEYIVGGENRWVHISDMADTTDFGIIENYTMDEGVVGKDSYYSYIFEWRWAFEGDDELDTLFGNTAEDENMSLALSIVTYAEQSANAGAAGGKLDSVLPRPVGGEYNTVAMVVILVLTVAIFIAIVVLIGYYFKKRKADDLSATSSSAEKRE